MKKIKQTIKNLNMVTLLMTVASLFFIINQPDEKFKFAGFVFLVMSILTLILVNKERFGVVT